MLQDRVRGVVADEQMPGVQVTMLIFGMRFFPALNSAIVKKQPNFGLAAAFLINTFLGWRGAAGSSRPSWQRACPAAGLAAGSRLPWAHGRDQVPQFQQQARSGAPGRIDTVA
jgi:hypothetical protein